MPIKFRPLNKVSTIMQKVGFEPGYAYDDLVFSNDAVFIIQFDDHDPCKLILFLNHDCEKNLAIQLETKLIEFSNIEGFTMVFGGNFSMEQKDGSEEITIKFVEAVYS